MRQRPPPHVTLISQKMGIHEWSYDSDITLDQRKKVPLREQKIALADVKAEVELGFDRLVGYEEAQRCLNCDVQTVFATPLCIECDACVDICPMDCITFTENGEEAELRTRLNVPAGNLTQDLYISSSAEDRPDHGQGRGPLPALRPLRRALPDRRVGHAEIPARHDARRRPERVLLMQRVPRDERAHCRPSRRRAGFASTTSS